MDSKVIKFRKLRFAEFFIILDLILIFSAGFLSMINKYAYNVTYLIDFTNLLLLLIMIKDRKKITVKNKNYKSIMRYMIILSIMFIVTSIFRSESLLLLLWASRRFIGYFIFFGAVVKYYRGDYLKLFNKIYWINFAMAVFEFFILHQTQDWLGGIFGIIGGTANAPLILFLSISTVIYFVQYFNKQITLSYLGITSVSSMAVASMGELKIFYFIFAIILFLTVVMTKFSKNKLMAIMVSFFIMLLGVSLLYKVFPNFDRNYFTVDFFLGTYASKQGYTSTHDVNRLYFRPVLNPLFKNKFEYLFGKGLGNCSYINFMKKYSNFYKNYYRLHYDWFSSTNLYIENGIIGFIMFFALFIIYIIYVRKQLSEKTSNIVYCEIGEVLAAIVLLFLLYNNSLFQAEAYLIYFILAFPFINKLRMEEEGNNNENKS